MGYLISGSEDKSMKVWNLIDNSLVKTMTGQSNVVTCLVIVMQNERPYLASANWDGNMNFWDLETFNLIKNHSDPSSNIESLVAFNANGKSYMAVGRANNIDLWYE